MFCFKHQWLRCLIVCFQLHAELLKCLDFESRINIAVGCLISAGIIAKKHTSDLVSSVRAFYDRIVMADNYKPSSQLRSTSVVLIRASMGSKQSDSLGEDYGLSTVCVTPVTVHVAEGSHETFIVGESATKVAQMIYTRLYK